MSFQNYRKQKAQRDDKGQATVEFALVLPFVVISLLLLMQVLVIVLAHVQVVNAARNGVRAAAVSAQPSQTAESVALRSLAGATDGETRSDFSVQTTTDARWVTVTVTQHLVTDLPIIGRFISDLDISSHFSMLLEPPLG
ncbi:MAG: TadE/TadG family type IV pilus assembly protein [Actinomycetes bacterium]